MKYDERELDSLEELKEIIDDNTYFDDFSVQEVYDLTYEPIIHIFFYDANKQYNTSKNLDFKATTYNDVIEQIKTIARETSSSLTRCRISIVLNLSYYIRPNDTYLRRVKKTIATLDIHLTHHIYDYRFFRDNEDYSDIKKYLMDKYDVSESDATRQARLIDELNIKRFSVFVHDKHMEYEGDRISQTTPIGEKIFVRGLPARKDIPIILVDTP